MRFLFGLILSVCFSNIGFSQGTSFTLSSIPENLKENANSVIREQIVTIVIKSVSDMKIQTKKAITVLNEKGVDNIDAFEYYDSSHKVNSIEATVYNANGFEIKKLKRKDFFDYSVAEGFEISEGRILTLRYTPTEYPFTIVYQSEVTSENTAFIPQWFPINDYYESVEKTEMQITYPPDLGFKYKEFNFENRVINKKESNNSITFQANNLLAEKREDFATSFQKNVPRVMFALDKFMLENVEGTSKSWKDFGIWMNDYLIKGTDELSLETQNRVKELVGSETDPIKKAKIIYQYMQDKTRYVSIQLGIGGWKPMLAKDVDRLGYGDCKALTNYTKALLKVVGVESYYTVIYGSNQIKDIIPDFVSMQGNHVVLMLPINGEYKLLECTSQTQPFGFGGNFTDDRLALIVKPEGGEIIRTNKYINNDNSQKTIGKVFVNEDGVLIIKAEISSKGDQYEDKTRYEKRSANEVKEYYKNRFSNLNNLSIESYKFDNNKQQIELKESLSLKASDIIKTNGTEWLIPLNYLNQYSSVPKRYRNRKSNFEVSRGFFDEDTFEIELPSNLTLALTPENTNLTSVFGEYKTEVSVENNKVLYKRTLLMNKGTYDKSEYENFRKFIEQIAKNDNLKIVTQKK